MKTFNITVQCCKIKDWRASTVDPDEKAHYEQSHLDLQCLKIQLLLCLGLYYNSNKVASKRKKLDADRTAKH